MQDVFRFKIISEFVKLLILFLLDTYGFILFETLSHLKDAKMKKAKISKRIIKYAFFRIS